ncbi:MAG TPA: KGG domain-containing protein [Vicinamibacterales bacterium]
MPIFAPLVQSLGRNVVAKEDRGFASMDRSKQREIASKGGKAAHQKGSAHEWTSEEAREAGRKGGMASHRRKQERQQANDSTDSAPRDLSGPELAGADDLV